MRAILMAATILLTPPGAIALQAPAALSGIVSGVGTNRPVTRAEVTLLNADGRPVQATTTDPGGRFTFDGLEAGRYRIQASRDGYVPSEYGQRHPNQPGAEIVVAAGERRNDLTLGMTPTGVISGRVRDIYGEPVVNARVEALRYSYQNGYRILSPVENALTNDLGQYRLFWMQPGDYVVRVSEGPTSIAASVLTQLPLIDTANLYSVGTSNLSDGDSFVVRELLLNATPAGGSGNAPVYYPGTAEAAQALTVSLPAGREVPGIDMLLTEQSLTTIRGRVVEGRTGTLPDGLTVSLVSNADVQVQDASQTRRPVNPDGTFEITGVAPGSYELTASIASFRNVQIRVGPDGQRTELIDYANSDEPMYARARLDVRSGTPEINNVVLELAPGFSLSGRVTPPLGESVDLTALQVSLAGDRPVFGVGISPADVNPDGTFTIEDLPPTRYRLRVSGLAQGMYLEDARVGVTDALNGAFGLDPVTAQGGLDIRLGSTPGTIQIATFDTAQNRVPGATIVLVPDRARRGQHGAYRTGTGDVNGIIRFMDVAPGDYTVFAFDSAPDGAWLNRDFLRPYESQGVPVRIGAGANEVATPVLIP